MNYINNLNHQFEAHSLDQILGYYREGDNDLIYEGGNYSGLSSIKSLLSGINGNHYSSIVFVPISSSNGFYLISPIVDYIYFEASSYQISFDLISYTDIDDVLSSSNFEYVDEYVNEANYNPLSSLQYSSFETHLSLNNQSFIFDLSQTKYNFIDYYYQNCFSLVEGKPSSQDLYYYYGLYVSGYEIYNTNITLSYSDVATTKALNQYDAVYGQGYGDGYNQGYQNGFRDGQATNIDGETAQAFDYISQSFSAISQILEIQVLPHITLGLAFSIPFTLVLIITIFKLIKK